MHRFQVTIICVAAGAILAVGLLFILRPAPSLSQSNDQMFQATLNSILAKLDRIDKKLDNINGRIGQVSTDVSRIYTRTGSGQQRPRNAPWTR